MTETCVTCGEQLTDGGMFKEPNFRLSQAQVEFVNFMSGTKHEELCNRCGGEDAQKHRSNLQTELDGLRHSLKVNSQAFPVFTTDRLPDQASYRLVGMITANVSVGTGLFNEFSQGLSDMFGVTNTESGMAFKVNSGEETARAILAQKALALDANCVIAVDIDYGTTLNNAATVNMQGTAAKVEDLSQILEGTALERAKKYLGTHERINMLTGWLNGDYSKTEAS